MHFYSALILSLVLICRFDVNLFKFSTPEPLIVQANGMSVTWYFKKDLRLKSDKGWSAYSDEESEKIEAAFQVGRTFSRLSLMICLFCRKRKRQSN